LSFSRRIYSKIFSGKNAGLKLEDYKEGDKQIPYAVLGEFKGQELEGMRYEQLLPYVQPADGDAFKVVLGDFVTTEDGTGIVILRPVSEPTISAPQNERAGFPDARRRQGRFTPEVIDFAGEL
jgi:isoleucyl-tRNA synthetase